MLNSLSTGAEEVNGVLYFIATFSNKGYLEIFAPFSESFRYLKNSRAILLSRNDSGVETEAIDAVGNKSPDSSILSDSENTNKAIISFF